MARSSCLVLLTTTSTLKNARTLARCLLDEKAAACVSILPGCESHYEWQGKKNRAKEYQLLIKTRSRLWTKARALILKTHTYEVPEILAVRVEDGHGPYLDWIERQTSL